MSYRKIYLAVFSVLILALNGVNAESFSDKFNSYKDQVQQKVQEKLDNTSMDNKIKEEFDKYVEKFKEYIGDGNYKKAEEYLSVVKDYSEKLASVGVDYGKKIYKDLKEKYKKAKETENYQKVEKEIKELKYKFIKAMKKEEFQKAKEYLNDIKEKLKDYGDKSISYTKGLYKKLENLYERKLESKKREKIEKTKTTKSGDNDVGAPDKYIKNKSKLNTSSKSVEKIKEEAQKGDYLSDSMKDKVSSKLNKIPDNKKVKYYEKVLDKIQSKRETITEKIEKQSSLSERVSSNYKRIFGVLNEVEQILKDKLQQEKENSDNDINSLLNGLF